MCDEQSKDFNFSIRRIGFILYNMGMGVPDMVGVPFGVAFAQLIEEIRERTCRAKESD